MTIPELHSATPAGAVLVVDDDAAVARSTGRILSRFGYAVSIATNGREAIELAATMSFDAIVSDICMPDVDGRELLRTIRARDLDVPFVFLTGSPDLASAVEAIEYGAFRYLLKPVSVEELGAVLKHAVGWRQLARVRREAALELDGRSIADRAGLEARFDSAVAKLWIAMQPIVSWRTRRLLAFEALTRSDEPSLRSPADLFDAAERLDRTAELGRAIRAKIATLVPSAPEGATLFVNLHPSDLEDVELIGGRDPLTAHAGRIVLEVTERAALDGVKGLTSSVGRLRALGFRIAIDDLGSGYAGLSSVAILEPEVVKADMSLVRGIETSPVKQKLFASMAVLCDELGIQLIAEGIETPVERDRVVSLGGEALQGYLFARPDRGFPAPRF
jgi:EAL domain-containing protein (putative c-di-GMP-specific phosphodiesterase class I)/ActR/RegA family two-component response regulator